VPGWWPHVARSREIVVGPLRWHVQHWPAPHPDAPVALLLHGTGAGTHSWRRLAPLLSRGFEVVAPDLPGHAFTLTPTAQSLTLPAVAGALHALVEALGCRPALVVGHSAGAAIALRMALDRDIRPALLVSVNGAILPLQGPLGRMFLPLARVLAVNPLVAPAFASWAALPRVTRQLLDGTGSRIDAEGERCYAALVSRAAHASGALRLMASWDLAALAADLPQLAVPLLLLAGARDRTLPPSHADRVGALLPGAAREVLPGLGHLAHEEAADAVLARIEQAWRGVARPGSAAAAAPIDAPGLDV
jgi:magnesium chelatase accessory protein